MTEQELEELFENCPKLFHMAEIDSWPSIKKYGLLSTTALLDLYEIKGRKRKAIEDQHRPDSVCITKKSLPGAVIRDQKAMSDKDLLKCLPKKLLSPTDWYRILNCKVFFWLSEERLIRLTHARNYRSREHLVLEVCTRSLVEAYRDKIWFCPINSGCTKPMPRYRDRDTFSKISDYPYSYWQKKRKRSDRVAELAIDYSVPDIKRYVARVMTYKDMECISVIG